MIFLLPRKKGKNRRKKEGKKERKKERKKGRERKKKSKRSFFQVSVHLSTTVVSQN